MKKQIQKMIDDLSGMIARAEEYMDSENETTAAKYEDIAANLGEALQSLEAALECE
jgi:ElaB/YqjD/DUF883 family membrane-anchored ribosome-binding protein